MRKWEADLSLLWWKFREVVSVLVWNWLECLLDKRTKSLAPLFIADVTWIALSIFIKSALQWGKWPKTVSARHKHGPFSPVPYRSTRSDSTCCCCFKNEIKNLFVVCHWHIHERSQNRLGKLSLLCIQVPARFNIEWVIRNGFLIPGKWGEMSVTTKKLESRKKKKDFHNPLKLKSCSWLENILFSPLALSLSLLRVVFM